MNHKYLIILFFTLFYCVDVYSNPIEKCKKEWATEYTMQKYCIDQVYHAANDISSYLERYGMTLDDWIAHKVRGKIPAVIYGECSRKYWTKGNTADIELMAYCLKTEEQAAIELGGIGGSAEQSIYFEDGVYGIVTAISIMTEYIERHGFGSEPEIKKAGQEGNVAGRIYLDCRKEEGGEIEQAKCLLRRESEELK